MKEFLRALRHRVRKTGPKIIFLLTLALCVVVSFLLVLYGEVHFESHSFGQGLYTGLCTVFNLLEGDSEYFRNLLQHGRLLHGIAYLLAFAMPFLTAAAVIQLILHHLPWFAPSGDTYYIFSELDARSVLLACDIHRRTGSRNVYLFLRTSRDALQADLLDQLSELRCGFYPYSESALLRHHSRLRGKPLRFFFLSEHTDENFQRIREFLEDVEKKSLFAPAIDEDEAAMVAHAADASYQQELYLLSETGTAPFLIDSLREKLCADGVRKNCFRWTELRLLDRYRSVSYGLLQEVPLYETARNGQNHILILGFGRVGMALFRAMVSFGVMVDHSMDFTLCDREIDNQFDSFRQIFPECAADLTVRPLSMDVTSSHLTDFLRTSTQNFTQIIVCLGDDEQNIQTAMRLKRFYRRRCWENVSASEPVISVNVEDPIKSDYTAQLFRDGSPSNSPLHTFGTDAQRFSVAALLPRKHWKAAQELHRLLTKQKVWELPLWQEYERRSSLACICHAPCHIHSVHAASEQDYAQILETHAGVLTDAEHRRWMAYVRSEGMQKVPFDTAQRYSPVTHCHVDVPGQLTPCLVDSSELDDLFLSLQSAEMIASDARSFRLRDQLVVENAWTLAKTAGLTDNQ